jgi:hypothetical protein
MAIDWGNFTPWSAVGGGVLIGAAAAMLWLSIRRTAGVSGIFAETLNGHGLDEGAWRLRFLVGMLLAPWLAAGAQGLDSRGAVSPLLLVLAGLLTGLGTRLARGCTSGHGVCGLSRLSVRSLVAVVSFMGAGMVVVTLLRVLGGSAA